MGRRVLDWNGLVRVAERRNPPDRLIFVHQLPARVVPHLSTDAGFYVRTTDEDDAGAYWSLRTAPEMVLLRQLVAAGAVTVEDSDADGSCAIAGCDQPAASDLVQVATTDGAWHSVCGPHWAAIFTPAGR